MTETYCYFHPDRETSLRCKRCDRLICPSCAQRTPTGYLCKECVKEHQKKFDTALGGDYVIVFLASAFLSAIGAVVTVIITSIIWGIFIIGLAPLAGTLIGNGARRLVKNRRSAALNYALAAGIVAGALPVMLFTALPFLALLFTGGAFNGNALGAIYTFSPLIWQLVYLFLAVPAAYYQFSGLVFKR
jgi:hypothetical protein